MPVTLPLKRCNCCLNIAGAARTYVVNALNLILS